MNDEFMYCPRCGAMAHIPKEELNEERLARALRAARGDAGDPDGEDYESAAAIAKAYREETDATD